METKKIIHPWGPVFDKNSRVLILGTIPSPKSREMKFFYGHPQNIFWKTLAAVLDQPEPPYSVPERKQFLLDNRIAAWDVLHSCEIAGASDSSIKNPVANDFSEILKEAGIRKIFTTGKKAKELYDALCCEATGMDAVYLPSTSPANRALQGKSEFWEAWKQVAEAIKS